MKMENIMKKMGRTQVTVSKDGQTKLNVSAPIAALALLVFNRVAVVGAVIALVAGYRFSLTEKAEVAKESEAVREEPVEVVPMLHVVENH